MRAARRHDTCSYVRTAQLNCGAHPVEAVYQNNALTPDSNLYRRQFVKVLNVVIKVLPLAVGECVLALLLSL